MKKLIFGIALVAIALTVYAVQPNTDAKAPAHCEQTCVKDSTKSCDAHKKAECKGESKKDCAKECTKGTEKKECCKADSASKKACCDKK